MTVNGCNDLEFLAGHWLYDAVCDESERGSPQSSPSERVAEVAERAFASPAVQAVAVVPSLVDRDLLFLEEREWGIDGTPEWPLSKEALPPEEFRLASPAESDSSLSFSPLILSPLLRSPQSHGERCPTLVLPPRSVDDQPTVERSLLFHNAVEGRLSSKTVLATMRQSSIFFRLDNQIAKKRMGLQERLTSARHNFEKILAERGRSPIAKKLYDLHGFLTLWKREIKLAGYPDLLLEYRRLKEEIRQQMVDRNVAFIVTQQKEQRLSVSRRERSSPVEDYLRFNGAGSLDKVAIEQTLDTFQQEYEEAKAYGVLFMHYYDQLLTDVTEFCQVIDCLHAEQPARNLGATLLSCWVLRNRIHASLERGEIREFS